MTRPQAPKAKGATKRTTTYKGAAARPTVPLVGKTDNQNKYIKALASHNQIIVMGPAGTGKTYIAVTTACNLYLTKKIDKIIVTRPNVSVGKTLGAFPGDLNEKLMPWMLPVFDVLCEHLGRGTVDTAIKNGNIEMAPFETMRGRSFKNAFVILDEAQNADTKEMKMFLTRTGENCTVVIDGDIMQSDLPGQSGLSVALMLVDKYLVQAKVVQLEFDDIVRSPICRQWIEAFYKEGL
jgi:phosphate starvation-inducible PhoH-like protein